LIGHARGRAASFASRGYWFSMLGCCVGSRTGAVMSVVFGERDVVLTGIAWFVFSPLVFHCDNTTDDR
jgi:hypothetical protein